MQILQVRLSTRFLSVVTTIREMMPSTQSNPVVLVVDDDANLLAFISEILGSEPVELAVATDGHMALECALRAKPDVILLDLFMPGLDGLETCRRLKADPSTRDATVIIMTSGAEPRRRVEAFQAGAADYVLKPLDEIELRARLRTHLDLRIAMRSVTEENARLQEQVRVRMAVEAEREQLIGALLERTNELTRTKQRLEEELVERARAEADRAALQERIISAQEARLRELAAPFIPITDRIAVIPLIGTMDAERAQLTMHLALRGVEERGCDTVILDVTAVQEMDAVVADVLVRISRGLALLGARAMITGIRPEVARMLTGLDIALGEFDLAASLQAGIARAIGGSAPHAVRQAVRQAVRRA